MEIVLDTSFILTAVKEKLDFVRAENYGRLILPRQVMEELKKLAGKKRGKEKDTAVLALDIIEKNEDKFEEVDLEGKYVDSGIKKYVKGKKEIVIATMDKELKKELKGKAKLLVVRGRKKLELI